MKAITNNSIIKAYNNGNSKKYFKYGNSINVIVAGNPTIENGIVSNFSSSDYLLLPYPLNNNADKIEIVFKLEGEVFNHSGSTRVILSSGTTVLSDSFGNSCNFVGYSFTSSGGYYQTARFQAPSLNYVYTNKDLLQPGSKQIFLKYVLQYKSMDRYPYSLKTFYSINGTDWIVVDSKADYNNFWDLNSTPLTHIGMGYINSEYTICTGKINLKKSYIKINDALWWTGTHLQECNADDDYDLEINTKGLKLPRF